MTELERYKEAIRIAICGFNEVYSASEGGYSFSGKAQAYLGEIDAILNPPPECEEVEVSAGWVNVYQRGQAAICGHIHRFREDADKQEPLSDSVRLDCREIRVKVKLPKPTPVEKSAVISLLPRDGEYSILSGDLPPESGTTTGTFTWTKREQP